jgi:mRNA-degrading endonuclease toxin of MazEF toxin-antitoxin module
VREICLVRLDKTRPALVLTREVARGVMTKVTVAPITRTTRACPVRSRWDWTTGWTTTVWSRWTTS